MEESVLRDCVIIDYYSAREALENLMNHYPEYAESETFKKALIEVNDIIKNKEYFVREKLLKIENAKKKLYNKFVFSGKSIAELAREFGIAPQIAHKIIDGKFKNRNKLNT